MARARLAAWLAPILAALAAWSPVLAQGQVVSAAPDKVSIVVYPGFHPYQENESLYEGLAMVTETRTVDLPAGPVRISFRGVAEGIVPQTVAVQGLPSPVREQNFDYQLLTPGSLIAASVGAQVRLVRTDRASGKVTEERARILSGELGVVLDLNEKVEALRCSGLPEKLVLDQLPPGFTDKPTLSLDTVALAAGRYSLTVSYLATGVSWAAEYVARIRPDGKALDLMSWVTIDNHSAASFSQAPIQVLAGALQRVEGETEPVQVDGKSLIDACWRLDAGRVNELMVTASRLARLNGEGGTVEDAALPMEAVAVTRREDLGDYKLYSLPQPLTLAAFQTKQVALFERRGVAFRRLYRSELRSLDPDFEDEEGVGTIIEIENETAAGLGLPLPKGQMAVFEAAGEGRTVLAGEAQVSDTPVGLPVEVRIGQAMGVTVTPNIIRRWQVKTGDVTRDMVSVEVVVANAKPSAAVVQFREGPRDDWAKVVRESLAHVIKDGLLQWQVRVPAGGVKVVSYTLQGSGR